MSLADSISDFLHVHRETTAEAAVRDLAKSLAWYTKHDVVDPECSNVLRTLIDQFLEQPTSFARLMKLIRSAEVYGNALDSISDQDFFAYEIRDGEIASTNRTYKPDEMLAFFAKALAYFVEQRRNEKLKDVAARRERRRRAEASN